MVSPWRARIWGRVMHHNEWLAVRRYLHELSGQFDYIRHEDVVNLVVARFPGLKLSRCCVAAEINALCHGHKPRVKRVGVLLKAA